MRVKALIKRLLECDMNDEIYISATQNKNEVKDKNHIVSQAIQMENAGGIIWIRNHKSRRVEV